MSLSNGQDPNATAEELIEEVGAELRQMMPWLKGKK